MGAAPDSAQLSAQLRAAVKAYCGHSSSLAHAATTANRLHADSAHAQALEALADQLGEAYGTINTLTDEEIRSIAGLSPPVVAAGPIALTSKLPSPS